MRDYSKLTKPTPEKHCAFCGQKLERKRYNGRIEGMGAFLRRKYCGRDCSRKASIKADGSLQDYRCSHTSARRIVCIVEGREPKCEICGSVRNIDVHHKDGDYHNNAPANLQMLCRSCHLKIHNPKPKCIICGDPVKGQGYCNKHYARWKKYGDPLMYYGHLVSPSFCERKKHE